MVQVLRLTITVETQPLRRATVYFEWFRSFETNKEKKNMKRFASAGISFLAIMIIAVNTAAQQQITWVTQADNLRQRTGERFTFDCPAGGTISSRLWGTGTYTDDSSICTAAVHSGLITTRSGGKVTIGIRPGAASYAGSTRNGVKSNAYGKWQGSFVFVRDGGPSNGNENETDIFVINNISIVQNQPSAPTVFKTSSPYMITSLQTYHWNNGRGTSVPGRIGFRSATGRVFGPWSASGTPGQGGVRNANWTASPRVILPAGTYTVTDSDPSTWSQNRGTGGRGFATVRGYPARNTGEDQGTAINWGSRADKWRGNNGRIYILRCPSGGTLSGRLWGTYTYTDDSSICTAAVHAGLITTRDGGEVRIEIRAGAQSYRGSTQNGITSRDYGAWTGSFNFVGVR